MMCAPVCVIAPPLVVTLRFPPSVIAGSAKAAAPLAVVRFESVVPPPIAPPSVIVPLPALRVSAWVFAAVPSIVPLNETALLVVARVVVDWSVVAPVKLCAPKLRVRRAYLVRPKTSPRYSNVRVIHHSAIGQRMSR